MYDDKNNLYICDICDKKSNYHGTVYYTEEKNLCCSHYLKFCRNKGFVKLKKRYSKAKPQTQQWYAMCRAKGKFFDKWFIEMKIQPSGKGDKK